MYNICKYTTIYLYLYQEMNFKNIPVQLFYGAYILVSVAHKLQFAREV
jgi:hypothetical protein